MIQSWLKKFKTSILICHQTIQNMWQRTIATHAHFHLRIFDDDSTEHHEAIKQEVNSNDPWKFQWWSMGNPSMSMDHQCLSIDMHIRRNHFVVSFRNFKRCSAISEMSIVMWSNQYLMCIRHRAFRLVWACLVPLSGFLMFWCLLFIVLKGPTAPLSVYSFFVSFFQTSFLTAINSKSSQNESSQTANKNHKKMQKKSPKHTHSQDL